MEVLTRGSVTFLVLVPIWGLLLDFEHEPEPELEPRFVPPLAEKPDTIFIHYEKTFLLLILMTQFLFPMTKQFSTDAQKDESILLEKQAFLSPQLGKNRPTSGSTPTNINLFGRDSFRS